MHPLKSGLAAAGTLLAMALPQAAGQPSAARPKRNVVIFVADGLRHDSVTAEETPALWRVRTEGVHFRNSYALFPTFTTANASAIATGHGLGDTGDFSNTLWLGHALFDGGNFNQGAGTPVSFIENDQILGDLSEHHGGNYLGRDTLVALARKHGYRTAVVGKVGPAAIQDPGLVTPNGGVFPPPSPSAIVVDDATGTGGAPALPPQLVAALQRLDIPTEAPARSNGYGATSRYNNGFSGDRTTAGTMSANVVQQQWFADVTTRAILPLLTDQADAPFLLVFWSRDPDGTQHNQGDSLNTLFPGINGDTSHLAVRNADRALQQLLEWLSAHPDIAANTDVVVTSDHGFATVSRREIDRQGHPTASEAAKHFYVDAAGRVDTDRGMLPQGFLAIDLSLSLHLELFDPDRRAPLSSAFPYARVRLDFDTWEHPANGNGLLGADVRRLDGADARAIVAANGGSDLIYVPDGNRDVVSRIAETLASYDYVGGIFVDDMFGDLPGTLPLSAIGLVGDTHLPRPALVVVFKHFYFNPADLRTAVQIADTALQEGQGMHGGLGRDSTFTNMAAIGPDFKTRAIDDAPAGNADIAPTIAHVLGFDLPEGGLLRGRVLAEALKGGPEPAISPVLHRSSSLAGGKLTVLHYQEAGAMRYLESACFVGKSDADCRSELLH